MNRKFLNVLFLVTAILGLASCGEDDKYEGVGLKAVSDGAYVVAYGTSTNPANLSYIDYKNSESTTNVLLRLMVVLWELELTMDLYMVVKCIL